MGVDDAMEKEGAESIAGDWYFNWASLTTFWAQFGGLVTIDYREAVKQFGLIVPAFQKEIGLDWEGEGGDYFINVTDVRHTGGLTGLMRKPLQLFRRRAGLRSLLS